MPVVHQRSIRSDAWLSARLSMPGGADDAPNAPLAEARASEPLRRLPRRPAELEPSPSASPRASATAASEAPVRPYQLARRLAVALPAGAFPDTAATTASTALPPSW